MIVVTDECDDAFHDITVEFLALIVVAEVNTTKRLHGTGTITQIVGMGCQQRSVTYQLRSVMMKRQKPTVGEGGQQKMSLLPYDF